jgi:hypothetical protein
LGEINTKILFCEFWVRIYKNLIKKASDSVLNEKKPSRAAGTFLYIVEMVFQVCDLPAHDFTQDGADNFSGCKHFKTMFRPDTIDSK